MATRLQRMIEDEGGVFAFDRWSWQFIRYVEQLLLDDSLIDQQLLYPYAHFGE